MPTGTYTQKDIPEQEIARVVAGFEAEAAVVKKIKQDDGRWTVVATFPER
jgi:hypothetical protein